MSQVTSYMGISIGDVVFRIDQDPSYTAIPTMRYIVKSFDLDDTSCERPLNVCLFHEKDRCTAGWANHADLVLAKKSKKSDKIIKSLLDKVSLLEKRASLLERQVALLEKQA